MLAGVVPGPVVSQHVPGHERPQPLGQDGIETEALPELRVVVPGRLEDREARSSGDCRPVAGLPRVHQLGQARPKWPRMAPSCAAHYDVRYGCTIVSQTGDSQVAAESPETATPKSSASSLSRWQQTMLILVVLVGILPPGQIFAFMLKWPSLETNLRGLY